MGFPLRMIVAAGLCLGLTACVTPRGAGFQSEVISASRPENQEALNFQVVPVTEETRAALSYWPAVGEEARSWIRNAGQPSSLIVASGDAISVTVWDTEENSLLAGMGGRMAQLQDVIVSSNGEINLPYIGDLRVAGMSIDTLRDRIEERYAETIPSAQVQVQVKPGRANHVNLVSGVSSPGVYPLEGRDVTVMSVLAQAGGAAATLENPQMTLIRGQHIYGISLERLFDHPELDAEVRGGDRIIVTEDERKFLSLGAAGSQAEHVFPSDVVTAAQALSIIGGVDAARANPKGILVLREYPLTAVRSDAGGPNKERVVFTIDLTTADGLFAARNFDLMDGDLVYATESPVNAARSILGLIGTALGVSNSL
ncbi:polysaccharide biosynthesis protein [Marivivens niveibacter]|uniref:Polysaccharide biosynthesis protein n=1 Tax=Marivivens niveibacter TaxID=1930667 RepID=A0A251WUY9_9RHOB|nr:polysaccharide biosynthesis/export family protein [Marivivens niveibacter]OUD08267.1 polysaccharide biosynthesis protein [Marivivens niveibacter]